MALEVLLALPTSKRSKCSSLKRRSDFARSRPRLRRWGAPGSSPTTCSMSVSVYASAHAPSAERTRMQPADSGPHLSLGSVSHISGACSRTAGTPAQHPAPTARRTACPLALHQRRGSTFPSPPSSPPSPLSRPLPLLSAGRSRAAARSGPEEGAREL
eukprot:scaffold7854_cov28-Tisochrysis_lutea.AAC.1